MRDPDHMTIYLLNKFLVDNTGERKQYQCQKSLPSTMERLQFSDWNAWTEI